MIDNISVSSPKGAAIRFGESANNTFGASFGDVLAVAMSENSLLEAAPDRWAYKFGDGYAVDIAVDFLKENFGIDANDRVPTHEITEEQKAWLASRHDLNNLVGDNFPDLGEGGRQNGLSTNFKADLVYLGIISPGEAKKLGAVPLYPGATFRHASETPDWLTSGNGMELINEAISRTQSQIDYVEELLNEQRSSDRAADKDFISRAEESILLQKTLYDILLSLYS